MAVSGVVWVAPAAVFTPCELWAPGELAQTVSHPWAAGSSIGKYLWNAKAQEVFGLGVLAAQTSLYLDSGGSRRSANPVLSRATLLSPHGLPRCSLLLEPAILWGLCGTFDCLQTCGSGVCWGRRPNCFPYHFPKGHAMLHTRDKSTTCLFSNRWFSPAHLNVETEVLLSWPGITPGWHHEGIKHCSLSMLAKYHTLGILFPAPAKPWSHGWASSPMNPAPFGFSR